MGAVGLAPGLLQLIEEGRVLEEGDVEPGGLLQDQMVAVVADIHPDLLLKPGRRRAAQGPQDPDAEDSGDRRQQADPVHRGIARTNQDCGDVVDDDLGDPDLGRRDHGAEHVHGGGQDAVQLGRIPDQAQAPGVVPGCLGDGTGHGLQSMASLAMRRVTISTSRTSASTSRPYSSSTTRRVSSRASRGRVKSYFPGSSVVRAAPPRLYKGNSLRIKYVHYGPRNEVPGGSLAHF